MYPTCVNLMDSMPRESDLTLSKLEKHGTVLTDACSTAWKLTNLTKQRGWSNDKIKIFKVIAGNTIGTFGLVQKLNNFPRC